MMTFRTFLLFFLLISSTFAFGQSYEHYKTLPDTFIHSQHLGFSKKLSVITPQEFQKEFPSQTFPLILIFDSQNKRSYQYILNTIDYLTATDQMPASVVIGVASEQQHRYHETQLSLSDPQAKGEMNEQFIFEELIPYARQNYQASDFTLLIGHSRYGYFTSYLLTQQDRPLNGVISFSPVFSQKNVNLLDSIQALNAAYPGHHHLYYRYGIGNDYPDDYIAMENERQGWETQNPHLDIKGQLYIAADHNATPGLYAGQALYEIFEFWNKNQNRYSFNDNPDEADLKSLRTAVKNHYGTDLTFSLGVLNGKGWDLYNKQDFAGAIQAWETTLEFYPNFSDAYLFIIYAMQQLNQDYTAVLNQLKESLIVSIFYSAEEKAEIQLEIESLSK
jgi:predicted alpha/beta superfamily hydrolase